MDSSKLEDLHLKLDKLALRSLDIVEQLLKERESLEMTLRDGYFELTRSRHVMNPKAVSSLQLPSSDCDKTITALVKVDRSVELDDELVQHFQFVVSSHNDDDDSEENVLNEGMKEDGLRKRSTKTNSKVQENLSKAFKKFGGKDDPLHWFGVLVPQSLRNCQQSFCAVTQSVCKIASLQTNLQTVQKEYKTLKRQLQQLTHDSQ